MKPTTELAAITTASTGRNAKDDILLTAESMEGSFSSVLQRLRGSRVAREKLDAAFAFRGFDVSEGLVKAGRKKSTLEPDASKACVGCCCLKDVWCREKSCAAHIIHCT